MLSDHIRDDLSGASVQNDALHGVGEFAEEPGQGVARDEVEVPGIILEEQFACITFFPGNQFSTSTALTIPFSMPGEVDDLRPEIKQRFSQNAGSHSPLDDYLELTLLCRAFASFLHLPDLLINARRRPVSVGFTARTRTVLTGCLHR